MIILILLLQGMYVHRCKKAVLESFLNFKGSVNNNQSQIVCTHIYLVSGSVYTVGTLLLYNICVSLPSQSDKIGEFVCLGEFQSFTYNIMINYP